MIGAPPRSIIRHLLQQLNKYEAINLEMTIPAPTMRHGVTRKLVYGSSSEGSFNGVKTFLAHMTLSELLRSCSLDLIPEHLRPIYDDIQRVATPRRRNGFEDFCYKHLSGTTDIGSVIPPVLVGCMHGVSFEKSGQINLSDWLEIETENTFVIDGIGRLSTGGAVIGGFDNFLLQVSRDSSARLARRAEIRDQMASLEIPVMFIFKDSGGALTEDEFAQMFVDVNGQQQPLTMNKLMKVLRSDPVTNLARELGELPVIVSHGGMSIEGEKITESSEYIMTLNSLTRFVLGGIGGFSMQSRLKGTREMPDGALLGDTHVNTIKSDLTLFLETWIYEQGDDFSMNRNGFQLVTTLIQSLGLVFHQVWNNCIDLTPASRTNHIYSVAEKLGRLDYSRRARHWSECSFLALSEDGTYKVASGGSTTRKYFAQHLCKKAGLSYT